MLTRFDWKKWFSTTKRENSPGRRRKQRQDQPAQMEALEKRELLTAQLDIVVVTTQGDADPLVGYLQENFSNVGSITTGSFERTDTRAAERATVSGADLVVVSRAANSPKLRQNAAEVDFWNGLSQPMFCSVAA